jgi:hypothetical protein
MHLGTQRCIITVVAACAIVVVLDAKKIDDANTSPFPITIMETDMVLDAYATNAMADVKDVHIDIEDRYRYERR